MENSRTGIKDIRGDKYFEYIDSRRLLLLKTLLFIFILVAATFIPVNISLGIWSLVYIEIGMIFFSLGMFYFLRNRQNLEKCSLTFVLVGATWSIISAVLPSTNFTTFVWNAYVPAFSFFLLGKRKGLVLSSVYLPIVISIFLYRNLISGESQPIVVVINIILYIVFISILYMYYESTRAHTENLLIDDIEARKKTEAEKVTLIDELKVALAEVKHLSGLLPVCSCCKKIRDDEGYWNKLEVFIEDRSEAQFSHGMCPNCANDLYSDVDVDFESIYKEEFPGWSEDVQKKVDKEQGK